MLRRVIVIWETKRSAFLSSAICNRVWIGWLHRVCPKDRNTSSEKDDSAKKFLNWGAKGWIERYMDGGTIPSEAVPQTKRNAKRIYDS